VWKNKKTTVEKPPFFVNERKGRARFFKKAEIKRQKSFSQILYGKNRLKLCDSAKKLKKRKKIY